MKKYKLLKDLPRAKAGEVAITEPAYISDIWILKIHKWNEDETKWMPLAYIHITKVNEWLEEIPEKPKSVWDLKVWDEYYTIYKYNICKMYVTDSKYFEVDYINPWHVFLTQKEAEQELEKRKAIQKIKKYCFENNIRNKDFKPHEHNYTILYDDLDKNFFIEYYEVSYFINDLWYFKTYEDCKKIIDNCEADLKIIFNV